MRTRLATIGTIALLLGPAAMANAQAQQAGTGRQIARASGHVHADGRCHGISYGTGARSCGTATGGPVGGLSGRN